MEPSRLKFADVRVATGPSVEFCLDPAAGDPVAAWLLEHGWIDEPVMRAFQGLVAPDARVIDLGCHLGTFSLPAAALGAEVIAVDATPRHAHLLGMAARRNGFGALHVVHGAITDSDGPVPFLERSIHGRVLASGENDPASVMAPPVSVDELVAMHGWDRVDLIKMDIEGSEPAALRGMHRLFGSGSRPAFVFECNGAALPLFGASIYALRGALAELGYELLMIDHLRPGTLVETDPGAVQPECVCDYLAFASRPPDLAEEWTVEPRFSREQTVTRWADAAASPGAGYRRYSAQVLAAAPPWFRCEPLVRLAAVALEHDIAADVRASFEWPEGRPPWDSPTYEPPEQGPPADVVVMARGISVPASSTEPDRPPVAERSVPAELVLTDLSLHVRAGGSLAILAADRRAGDAAVAVIAGLAAPECGELTVRWPATVVSRPEEVFEPELPIEENAVLFAAFLGCDVRTAGSSIGEAVRRAGLWPLWRKPVGEFGAEEQAKLALAVAIECAKPELLLIDRLAPIADLEFRGWFGDRVRRLRARGGSVIELIDDPEELLTAADRMLWLDGPVARASGHPDAVIALARGNAIPAQLVEAGRST